MLTNDLTRRSFLADVAAGRRIVIVSKNGAKVLDWLTSGQIPQGLRISRGSSRRWITGPTGGRCLIATEQGARGHDPDLWVIHHPLCVDDWSWLHRHGNGLVSLEPDPATTRCPAPV